MVVVVVTVVTTTRTVCGQRHMAPMPGTLNSFVPAGHGWQTGTHPEPIAGLHAPGRDGSGMGLPGTYGCPPQFMTRSPHVNTSTVRVRPGICVHPNVVGAVPCGTAYSVLYGLVQVTTSRAVASIRRSNRITAPRHCAGCAASHAAPPGSGNRANAATCANSAGSAA